MEKKNEPNSSPADGGGSGKISGRRLKQGRPAKKKEKSQKIHQLTAKNARKADRSECACDSGSDQSK